MGEVETISLFARLCEQTTAATTFDSSDTTFWMPQFKYLNRTLQTLISLVLDFVLLSRLIICGGTECATRCRTSGSVFARSSKTPIVNVLAILSLGFAVAPGFFEIFVPIVETMPWPTTEQPPGSGLDTQA